MERHRLLQLFYRNETNLYRDRLRVLHLAPESCFQKQFEQQGNLDYVSADLRSPRVTVKTDITDMVFEDKSFDVVLCSHVLEHIPDDRKAMAELFRVLKPEGWAVLQVPIDTGRAVTYEDESITSPEERQRAFGLFDHVRVYGRDYKDRLEAAGFVVRVIPYAEHLSEEDVRRNCIVRGDDVYLCTRPGSVQ